MDWKLDHDAPRHKAGIPSLIYKRSTQAAAVRSNSAPRISYSACLCFMNKSVSVPLVKQSSPLKFRVASGRLFSAMASENVIINFHVRGKKHIVTLIAILILAWCLHEVRRGDADSLLSSIELPRVSAQCV